MKVYISGQITGLDEITCIMNFRFHKEQIRLNHGILFRDIIIPLDLKPFLGVKSWLCYMITDIHHLRKCTHIAMQNNWIHSRGACIEHYFAKFIFKLEVIYL